MEFAAVQGWIDGYLDAWRTNDPERIGSLFAEDATYGYRRFGERLQGRSAIVSGWLDDPDEPESWWAEYAPSLIDGRRAIITGETRYADGKTYSNLFVVEFDDDERCRTFTEWFMRHPKPKPDQE